MQNNPVNRFGHLGKQDVTDLLLPYLLDEGLRRVLTRSMKEQELRELDQADRRHGLDREAQTYALTRKPDNSYVFRLPEAAVTDVLTDGELPNKRYHDRVFPRDHARKRKAKRRQQKQARRKH